MNFLGPRTAQDHAATEKPDPTDDALHNSRGGFDGLGPFFRDRQDGTASFLGDRRSRLDSSAFPIARDGKPSPNTFERLEGRSTFRGGIISA